MPSPFKPSDFSFIPELFFDLIARILPGGFILGLIYLYLEVTAPNIETDPPTTVWEKSLEAFDKMPDWFSFFFAIGLAYYLSISFAMFFGYSTIFGISRQDNIEEKAKNNIDEKDNIEKMEDNINKIYEKVPVEERPRFLRIIAEKNAAISLLVGLSFFFIFSLISLVSEKHPLEDLVFTVICIFFVVAMCTWNLRLDILLEKRLKLYLKPTDPPEPLRPVSYTMEGSLTIKVVDNDTSQAITTQSLNPGSYTMEGSLTIKVADNDTSQATTTQSLNPGSYTMEGSLTIKADK